jgi:1-pyrroline-5-carboxylate dehydrogenase
MFVNLPNKSSNLVKLVRVSSSISKAYRYKHNYTATNEPILDFKKSSAERQTLHARLLEYLRIDHNKHSKDALFDVPCVIGDKEIRLQDDDKCVKYQVIPFEHGIRLARFYHADKELIHKAIESCMEARVAWEQTSIEYRANILLKAADKVAGEKRADILAATMLGQGKTVFQAGNYLFY